MNKNLTLKAMVATITEAGIKEREWVWTTFWNMKCMGYISCETWEKFFERCKELEMDINPNMEQFRF